MKTMIGFARWFGVLWVLLAAEIAALFLAPFVVAFADRDSGRLPGWFWWMETPDDPLPGGTYEPTVKAIYDRFGFYVGSVYWLGWRNRAHALAMRFAWRPSMMASQWHFGPKDVGDDAGQARGWCFFRMTECGKEACELYVAQPLWGEIGLRVRIGFKLQPFFLNAPSDWPNDLSRSAWGMPVFHVSIRKFGPGKSV